MKEHTACQIFCTDCHLSVIPYVLMMVRLTDPAHLRLIGIGYTDGTMICRKRLIPLSGLSGILIIKLKIPAAV